MPRPLTRRSIIPRTALARLPRRPRRRGDEPNVFELCSKRALKASALRDCGRRCVYCAIPLARESATLDHVWPRSQGGTNTPGNCVAACVRCNRLKGDMLPHEFFLRFPVAGLNFMRYAHAAHRALKRNARRAVSLAYAA